MFPNKLLWYTNYSAGMNVTMLLFWSFVWVLTTRESWHFIKVVLETIFFVLSQTWEVYGWAQATSVKQSSAGTANVPIQWQGMGGQKHCIHTDIKKSTMTHKRWTPSWFPLRQILPCLQDHCGIWAALASKTCDIYLESIAGSALPHHMLWSVIQ